MLFQTKEKLHDDLSQWAWAGDAYVDGTEGVGQSAVGKAKRGTTGWVSSLRLDKILPLLLSGRPQLPSTNLAGPVEEGEKKEKEKQKEEMGS